jgi:hypothetical protein
VTALAPMTGSLPAQFASSKYLTANVAGTALLKQLGAGCTRDDLVAALVAAFDTESVPAWVNRSWRRTTRSDDATASAVGGIRE